MENSITNCIASHMKSQCYLCLIFLNRNFSSSIFISFFLHIYIELYSVWWNENSRSKQFMHMQPKWIEWFSSAMNSCLLIHFYIENISFAHLRRHFRYSKNGIVLIRLHNKNSFILKCFAFFVVFLRFTAILKMHFCAHFKKYHTQT